MIILKELICFIAVSILFLFLPCLLMFILWEEILAGISLFTVFEVKISGRGFSILAIIFLWKA